MTLAERDRQTLEEAHIDLDEVATEIAALIRRDNRELVSPITDALSEPERAFLRRGGAIGLDPTPMPLGQIHLNIQSIASEFAKMTTEAYTQKQAAELLCVTPGRIRQRIDERSLYAVASHKGRVCPLWQFFEGKTLPGLEQVLKAISPDAHPIAVLNFFMTPNPDLESPILDTQLSPRDWLISGHPVDEVVILGREL
jgi:hypothetical protein